jgi:hypothetical protein
MKMVVGRWWNDTEGGKTELLEEKPVPVQLFAPQISHETAVMTFRDVGFTLLRNVGEN